MMATFLGFGGRMGRLSYFLWSLAVAAGLAVLTVVLVFGALGGSAPEDVFWRTVLVVVPLALWVNAALASKRLRDIGWSPLWVLPGWLCFGIIDAWVAMEVPALATGDGGQTVIGLVVELGMVLALLFWPGCPEDEDYEPLDVEATRRSYREAHLRRRFS